MMEGNETEKPVAVEEETADAAEEKSETTEETAEATAEAPEVIEEATETTEETVETAKQKKGINGKKIIITASCIAGVIAAVYLGGAAFYSNHFFAGTNIGSTDISNMTVAKAAETIDNDIDSYTFTFFEKDDKQEVITGEEIHLTHGNVEGLDKIMSEQNPFAWPASFDSQEYLLNAAVSYDEDALYNRITQMDFMAHTRDSIVGRAQDIHYKDGLYTIDDNGADEIVSLVSLYNKVKPKIYGLYKGMSLEKENCYEGLEHEDTIRGVLAMLNRYAGTKVTYLNGDSSTLLDGSTINNWLTVSDDYIIRIDEAKAKEYVKTLAESYNSVGKSHAFRTTGGSDITVSGGNYGWRVDTGQETGILLDIIRSGETVEREPVYTQSAKVHGANDIGKTYVEISIGAQHMWYYKDGALVASSDVVTGNPNKGNATPTGVYRIAYKAKDTVLKGEDYESPVSFWMPFNGGIGLHDATWRGVFGGNIYIGGGSHGCVNLPYNTAQTLFGHISAGDPVVVY